MNDNIFFGFDSLFAARLRSLIDSRNISKQQLAESIGVSRQAVSQYSDGSTVPNAEKLARIADYFNVSTDYLLGRTDQATTDITVKAICDYTGLSQASVEALCDMSHFAEDIKNTVNALLEDEYYLMMSDLGYSDYSHTEKSFNLLGKISHFLNVPDSDAELHISESGKITDINRSSEEYQKTHWKDLSSIKTVRVGNLIQKVLLDDVTGALKAMRINIQARKPHTDDETSDNKDLPF